MNYRWLHLETRNTLIFKVAKNRWSNQCQSFIRIDEKGDSNIFFHKFLFRDAVIVKDFYDKRYRALFAFRFN